MIWFLISLAGYVLAGSCLAISGVCEGIRITRKDPRWNRLPEGQRVSVIARSLVQAVLLVGLFWPVFVVAGWLARRGDRP